MSVLEELKTARETLVRDGWCQGEFNHPDGRHCLLGAFPKDERDDIINVLGTVIGSYRVVRWNDTPGRTFEQVLTVLDEAIEVWTERDE